MKLANRLVMAGKGRRGNVGVIAPPPTDNEPSGMTQVFLNPMVSFPAHNPAIDEYGFREYFGTTTLSIETEGPLTFMRATFPEGTPGGGGLSFSICGYRLRNSEHPLSGDLHTSKGEAVFQLDRQRQYRYQVLLHTTV